MTTTPVDPATRQQLRAAITVAVREYLAARPDLADGYARLRAEAGAAADPVTGPAPGEDRRGTTDDADDVAAGDDVDPVDLMQDMEPEERTRYLVVETVLRTLSRNPELTEQLAPSELEQALVGAVDRVLAG